MKYFDLLGIYEGEVENGIPHGTGNKTYDGLEFIYHGPWEKGRKSGKGMLLYRNNMHEITFKKGVPKILHSEYKKNFFMLFHPFITFEESGYFYEKLDGSKSHFISIKSEFCSDLSKKIYKFESNRFEIKIYENKRYYGEWNQKPEGFGILIGIKDEYRGFFREGKFHGKGFLIDKFSSFKGEFYHGHLYGLAVQSDLNQGFKFKGNFKGFQKNGMFKVYISDYKIKIKFIDDKPESKGKIFQNKLLVYEGKVDSKYFSPLEKSQEALAISVNILSSISSSMTLNSNLFLIKRFKLEQRQNISYLVVAKHCLNNFNLPIVESWNLYETEKIELNRNFQKDEEKIKIFSENGESFEGVVNRLSGDYHGIYRYSNLNRYIGQLNNWKREGTGKLIMNNNQFYFGGWKNDNFHGKGVIFCCNFKLYGHWEDGNLTKISRVTNQNNQ